MSAKISRRQLIKLTTGAIAGAIGTNPVYQADQDQLERVENPQERAEIVAIVGEDGTRCSGSVVSESHVLTAAHSVHDLHEQGEPTSRLEVYPAREESLFPFDHARVTHVREYPLYEHLERTIREIGIDGPRWIDYDIALLTLDRKIGSSTGILTSFSPDNRDHEIYEEHFRVFGYPGEPRDDSSFTLWRNSGRGDGIRESETVCIHCHRGNTHDLGRVEIRHGMSGGPILDENDQIISIISGMRRGGRFFSFTYGPRISNSVHNRIDEWITIDLDESENPPADDPILVLDSELWSETATTEIAVNTDDVVVGDDILRIERDVRNVGTTRDGEFVVDFLLFGPDTATLGSNSFEMPSPFTTTTVDWEGRVPEELAEGEYQIQVRLAHDNEYETVANSGTLAHTEEVGNLLPPGYLNPRSHRTEFEITVRQPEEEIQSLERVRPAGDLAVEPDTELLFEVGPGDLEELPDAEAIEWRVDGEPHGAAFEGLRGGALRLRSALHRGHTPAHAFAIVPFEERDEPYTIEAAVDAEATAASVEWQVQVAPDGVAAPVVDRREPADPLAAGPGETVDLELAVSDPDGALDLAVWHHLHLTSDPQLRVFEAVTALEGATDEASAALELEEGHWPGAEVVDEHGTLAGVEWPVDAAEEPESDVEYFSCTELEVEDVSAYEEVYLQLTYPDGPDHDASFYHTIDEFATVTDGSTTVATHETYPHSEFFHRIDFVYLSTDGEHPEETRREENLVENPFLDAGEDCRDLMAWEPSSASITVEDQESDGTTIVMDAVDLSHGGFVAVFDADASPRFDDPRGASAALEPGTHSDVDVALEEPLEEDGTVVAAAYHDLTDDGELTVDDEPYLTVGEDMVSREVPADEATVNVTDEVDRDLEVSFPSCTRAEVSGTLTDGDPVAASTGFYDEVGYGNTLLEDGVRVGEDVSAPFTGTIGFEIGEESRVVEGDGDTDLVVEIAAYGAHGTIISGLTTDPDDHATAAITHGNPRLDECLEEARPDRPALEVADATPTGDGELEVRFVYENPNDGALTASSAFAAGTTADEPPEAFDPGEGSFTATWTPETADERLVWEVDLSTFEYDEPVRAETAAAGEYAPLEEELAVRIVGTNAPVEAGETLEVAVELANEGGQGATADVVLLVGDVQEPVDATTATVEPGETVSLTLAYETFPVEQDVTVPVRVEAGNASDERAVEVVAAEADPPDEPEPEETPDDPEPPEPEPDEPEPEQPEPDEPEPEQPEPDEPEPQEPEPPDDPGPPEDSEPDESDPPDEPAPDESGPSDDPEPPDEQEPDESG